MTDSATGGRSILKRDKKCRVRSTADQRQEMLEQFARSGLSGPEFARVAGLPYQTLANWRHKHKKKALALRPATTQGQSGVRPCRGIRLVEVVAATEPAVSVRLKIDLPGGASMVVADPTQSVLAAQLIKALAAALPSPSSC
jgi:transposase-like protein